MSAAGSGGVWGCEDSGDSDKYLIKSGRYGGITPFSQLATVLRPTPIFTARSPWESPFSSRRCLITRPYSGFFGGSGGFPIKQLSNQLYIFGFTFEVMSNTMYIRYRYAASAGLGKIDEEEAKTFMASDVASRDQYLTFALFSRSIIEALKELVQQGKRERLQTALPAAIDSLQAATDSRHHHLSGYGLRVARSYDQIRTINDLFSQAERLSMINTLKSLQEDGAGAGDAKQEALDAIKFFYTIENRALRNYRHPSPRAYAPRP